MHVLSKKRPPLIVLLFTLVFAGEMAKALGSDTISTHAASRQSTSLHFAP